MEIRFNALGGGLGFAIPTKIKEKMVCCSKWDHFGVAIANHKTRRQIEKILILV